ncbi:alanine racemase [Actinomadura alba]|uniref:Alanine racemase n=1 Tax=Actinomadura alba TaxID=406431 RepID=A0ABR7LYF9_9ACTN|nr:alanine racemase [Actinomadura alba]MBC6469423.1 alanine racemase [Actinomadura alba]
MLEPPPRVRACALELERFPAYVYDLAGLGEHAAAIRTALPNVEIFYAAKANPDPPILAALEPYVDGIEVSSGGELAHVARALPGARLAFGGPGKTDEELELALRTGVHRIHVESPRELERLAAIARRLGHEPGVLLRANLDVTVAGAALTMDGPFGMDDAAIARCLELLPRMPWVRPYGVHAHLASGLAAPVMLELAGRIVRWADRMDAAEVNLGGGMAVDYRAPGERFDWAAYGAGLARLAADGRALRVEPGRAVAAYHGWYVTDVLEVKHTRDAAFAVLRGGTHHLRTPAAKGHDQPFAVLPRWGAAEPDGGPPGTATLVGQLCTPKDVFARAVPVGRLREGDLVAFGMAGAYAWNISHHGFLMHPEPAFHYLTG